MGETMLLLACCLAVVWGGVWAAFLQFTRIGQFLAQKRTWITVVIGVGVDLLLLLLVLDWAAWRSVVLVIALSSVAVIGRSLYNELRDEDEILDVIKNQVGQ